MRAVAFGSNFAMVKTEYTSTNYTIEQINNAVNTILTRHDNDYKLHESNTGSIKLLCRTGYGWNNIAEFKWNQEKDHLDIIIECKPNPNAPSVRQIQQEYAEKYLLQLSTLFVKYADKSPLLKNSANRYKIVFKKRMGLILSSVIIVVVILVIIMYYEYLRVRSIY